MKNKLDKKAITDFALGKLSPEDSLKILEKIESDPEASEHLELVATMVNFAQTQGKEVFEPGVGETAFETSPLKRFVREVEGVFRVKRFAYPIAAAMGVILVAAGLAIASFLSTSQLDHLAMIDQQEITSRVRGPAQGDLADGYKLLSEGRWDESIKLYERHIRAFPQDDLVDYAHYSAGAACLVSSRRSFLSLFPSYEHDRVRRGMEHLDRAANISRNSRVVEESRWLRAKGFLMLDEPREAIDEMERVRAMNGARSEEASRILKEIERIGRGG